MGVCGQVSRLVSLMVERWYVQITEREREGREENREKREERRKRQVGSHKDCQLVCNMFVTRMLYSRLGTKESQCDYAQRASANEES